MEYQKQLQLRRQKGIEIAKTGRVKMQGNKWSVPSQSINKYYDVILRLDKSVCNCPDYQERAIKCKHIFAVEITVSKSLNQDGSVTVTQTKRITYSQNWPAYNASQIQEQDLFMKLLGELCREVDEPMHTVGRPTMPLGDMVFASGLKVYSTFSLRRFMSDMRTARDKGYVSKVSSYSTVSNYMRKKELTPILQMLITLSSLSLKAVETKFAIDSTGFRTTRFNEYCKEKHDTKREHQWLKAHICTGVKTNIITGVEVTGETGADNNQFIPLSKRTFDTGFTIDEMSADKAYSSRDNFDAIAEMGGTAYIPFRSNATGKARGSILWKKMYRFFTYNRDEFMAHYHLRSNVESTNNMIKAKFTDLVRSKDKVAQFNEVLLKVLCHNIVVLIQEMHELGIEPNFIKYD